MLAALIRDERRPEELRVLARRGLKLTPAKQKT